MTDPLTQTSGTHYGRATAPRTFLVVYLETGSRVVDLPLDTDITFGRSRGATISIDSEKISRLHARVRHRATQLEVEDLGSRNGTWVNGERIAAVHTLAAGDEIAIGPVRVVVGATSGLGPTRTVADATGLEQRLAAEVDRSVRYRRPLALALLRIPDERVLEHLATALRPMDLLGEDVGDDHWLLLPELDRPTATATIQRLLAEAHAPQIRHVLAIAPDDGTTADTLVTRLRGELRTGRASRPTPTATITTPLLRAPAMRRVYELVDRVADSPMTALVLGETGVGKELVAEAIHARSRRRDQPLVKLNCAALPENLLESELFGHERGAFTGADRRKVGFFEAATGGSLFLDEIGDMPPALQAKLLRVLERKLITRVGGTDEVAVDVRVIAATHKDLEQEVREGRFRQDLLFRVAGFTIAVPPLRDRPDEIVPLAEHFLRTAAAEQHRAVPAFTDDARAAMLAYGWPGNVRELRNAMERALVLADDRITRADLPDRLGDVRHQLRPVAASGADVRGQLAEVERAAIVEALEAERANQTRAARRLGLSRRALIYKMEKYGLKPPPPKA